MVALVIQRVCVDGIVAFGAGPFPGHHSHGDVDEILMQILFAVNFYAHSVSLSLSLCPCHSKETTTGGGVA